MEVIRVNSSSSLTTSNCFPVRAVSRHSLHESRLQLLHGSQFFDCDKKPSHLKKFKRITRNINASIREKDQTDDWAIYLLKSISQRTLHYLNLINNVLEVENSQKLLWQSISESNVNGKQIIPLLYPTSMAINPTRRDIYLTDYEANRIICISFSGVIRWVMPVKLREKLDFVSETDSNLRGNFKGPISITVLPNGWIAIADRMNQRVQVLRGRGNVRYILSTKTNPVGITSDLNSNIYVITEFFKIEVYINSGKYISSVPIPRDVASGKKLLRASACVLNSGRLLRKDLPIKKWLIVLTTGLRFDLHLFLISENDKGQPVLVHSNSIDSNMMFGNLAGKASALSTEDVDDVEEEIIDSSEPSSNSEETESQNLDDLQINLEKEHSFLSSCQSSYHRNTKRFIILPEDDSLCIGFLMSDLLNFCVIRGWINCKRHEFVPQLSTLVLAPKSIVQRPAAIVKLPRNRLALVGLICDQNSVRMENDPRPAIQIWGI